MSWEALTPTRVRAAHEAVLTPTHPEGCAQPLDDLCCFYQFDRWTVRDFAARWCECDGRPRRAPRTEEAMARRRLQHLLRLGLVNCLAGRALAAQRADLAGRPGDLYFLSPLGARVLLHHLRIAPNALRAPDLALDGGRAAGDGLAKHRRARSGAWDAHRIACQRLTIRHAWLDDPDWHFARRLPLAIPLGEREAALIPDAWAWEDGVLFAIDLEGTAQREHVREKHAKYAALARALAPAREVQLTVVFASAAFRRRMLPYHELTYARGDGGYAFGWIDYEAALAAAPGDFWGARQFVDRQAVRERLRAYHEREAEILRDW
jgi:hypothetical protein